MQVLLLSARDALLSRLILSGHSDTANTHAVTKSPPLPPCIVGILFRAGAAAVRA
jgi:hypothetical protein